MSFQAVLEILVYFDRFNNLALSRQGCYRVASKIATEFSDVNAIPLDLFEFDTSQRSASTYISHTKYSVESHIVYTPEIVIRYIDEIHPIGDAVQFRIEFETNEKLEYEPLVLECQLQFASIKGKLEPFDFAEEEWSTIQTRRFRLNHAIPGIHEYVGLVFQDAYVCEMVATVHTVLLDYGFRPRRSIQHPFDSGTSTPTRPFKFADYLYNSDHHQSTSTTAAAIASSSSSSTSAASSHNNSSSNLAVPSGSAPNTPHSQRHDRMVQLTNELHRSCMESLYTSFHLISSQIAHVETIPELRLPSRLLKANKCQTTAAAAAATDSATSDSSSLLMKAPSQMSMDSQEESHHPNRLHRALLHKNNAHSRATRSSSAPATSPTSFPSVSIHTQSDSDSDSDVDVDVDENNSDILLTSTSVPSNSGNSIATRFGRPPLVHSNSHPRIHQQQQQQLLQQRQVEGTEVDTDSDSDIVGVEQSDFTPARRSSDTDAEATNSVIRRINMYRIENSKLRSMERVAKPFAQVEPRLLAHVLATDFHFIAEQIFQLWHLFLKHFPTLRTEIVKTAWEQHRAILYERSVLSLYRESYPSSLLLEGHRSVIQCSDMASSIRKSDRYMHMKSPSVQHMDVDDTPTTHPIVLEQRFTSSCSSSSGSTTAAAARSTSSSTAKKKNTVHVFVCVHGFEGNSFDLRLYKAYISRFYTGTEFLMSAINEDATNGDIRDMSLSLAREINTFIVTNHLQVEKLSFICHSLGGVIARCALQELDMATYLPKLHTFMTLSSPHCGVVAGGGLMESAMSIFKSWKKAVSLGQLLLQDTAETQLEESLLFKLSHGKGLQYFKHVMLFGSYQDRYVPFNSAVIQPDPSLTSGRGPWVNAMAESLLQPFAHEEIDGVLYRFDVSFGKQGGKLDTAIGRAAHIFFLDSSTFVQMVALLYPECFSL